LKKLTNSFVTGYYFFKKLFFYNKNFWFRAWLLNFILEDIIISVDSLASKKSFIFHLFDPPNFMTKLEKIIRITGYYFFKKLFFYNKNFMFRDW